MAVPASAAQHLPALPEKHVVQSSLHRERGRTNSLGGGALPLLRRRRGSGGGGRRGPFGGFVTGARLPGQGSLHRQPYRRHVGCRVVLERGPVCAIPGGCFFALLPSLEGMSRPFLVLFPPAAGSNRV